MSYERYRADLIGSYFDYQLESFLTRYHPSKKTLILLPGGMGSQLERTESPYPNSPNVITDVVWLDLGIAPPSLDGLKLEIDLQGKDKDSYVVAPHGPIAFIGVTPYEKLEEFAHTEDWNYCVFGFDWRRPIEESSGFFKEFILGFRQQILDKGFKDPMPGLTIACHSMGGMVCTDALRDARVNSLRFNAVVTIATPFYGTANQQQAYFVGEPGVLNDIYGAKTVVRIVSSLPGPYALFYLPKSIYNRDGAELGLTRYPEFDPNGNVDVDPYDQSPSVLRRWPKVVRDHRKYLVGAQKSMEKISNPIDVKIAPRFFNVRSSLDRTTAVELLWNDVDGDTIDPSRTPSPVTGVAGPGDGTVPAWSAFHAYCRPGNRYELTQAADHPNLLQHDEVLRLIGSIVMTGKLPTRMKTRAAQPRVATDRKVAQVATKWAARAKRRQPPPAELLEKPVQRAILASLISGPKPHITRRAPRTRKRTS
jgi:pimeloyl-ACP methyl ester carboxylesterase